MGRHMGSKTKHKTGHNTDSYKYQSPLQRKIFRFKEFNFQELQRAAHLGYSVVFWML